MTRFSHPRLSDGTPIGLGACRRSCIIQRRLTIRSDQGGLSLIELLIAMAIGLFLMLGIIAVLISTNQSYAEQTKVAQLNDKQRFAMMIMSSIVQSAGHQANPAAVLSTIALPANAIYTTPGQKVFAAVENDHDTLRARFQTSPGDSTMTCLGGTNTSAAKQEYDNKFSVANNNLQCEVFVSNVSQGAALVLVDGISNMQVMFGVDTDRYGWSPPTASTVTDYVSIDKVVDWTRVRAVQIAWTFINPLYNAGNAANQPQYVKFKQTIPVMYTPPSL